jgi:mono/diheme cytochrome c family protein
MIYGLRLGIQLLHAWRKDTLEGPPITTEIRCHIYADRYLADERAALAVYLALLGGASPSSSAEEAGIAASVGARYFQERCAACHGGDAQWPVAPRVGGHSAKYFYDLLGRLPASNEIMPRFEGSDDERRALAAYLVTLGAPASSQEGVR